MACIYAIRICSILLPYPLHTNSVSAPYQLHIYSMFIDTEE